MSCKICFEDISADGFIKLECEHSVCKNCLAKIIEVNIRAYSPYNIRCPEVKCMKPISNQLTKAVIANHGSDKLLRRFEKIETDQLLVKDPSLQLCVNDECRNLIKTGPSDAHVFINCDKCKAVFCIDCRQTEHPNNDCPVRDAEGIEHLKQSRQVLPCPKCKINIQKVDGCNEMKCPLCRDQFCWVCGQRKGDWHYSYLNLFGCPGMQLQTKKPWQTRLKSLLLLSLIALLIGAGIYIGYLLLVQFFWLVSFFIADLLFTYTERRHSIRLTRANTWLGQLTMLMFFDDFVGFAKRNAIVVGCVLGAVVMDWVRFAWTKRTRIDSRRNNRH
jgi:hypothetical protein